MGTEIAPNLKPQTPVSVNDIYDLQNISRLASYVQHLRNEKGGRHRMLLTFNGDFLGPSVLSQVTALSRTENKESLLNS